MLVDGTSLGLGVLLERLGNSTATPVGNLKVTPKAKANGTRPAKAQVKVDSGILQKMGLQKSGNFFGPEKFEGKKRGGGCNLQSTELSRIKTVDPGFVT